MDAVESHDRLCSQATGSMEKKKYAKKKQLFIISTTMIIIIVETFLRFAIIITIMNRK